MKSTLSAVLAALVTYCFVVIIEKIGLQLTLIEKIPFIALGAIASIMAVSSFLRKTV